MTATGRFYGQVYERVLSKTDSKASRTDQQRVAKEVIVWLLE